MIDVRCTVNGRPVEMTVDDRYSLADALRDHLGLTGVHLGCEQGICGTCTVVCDGAPVRSCLMLAAQADGTEIVTVEGLAGDGDDLHPVQVAFLDHRAQQCGYCTPGFVTLLAAGVTADDDEDDLVELVASNICRCTGYQPILDAARDLRDQRRAGTSAGEWGGPDTT